MFARVFAVGALLFVTVGIGPAAAAGIALRVTPSQGRPGAAVSVRGTGFPSRASVAFSWDGAAAASAPVVMTGRSGSFSASLTLPSLTAGNHVLGASAGGASA